VTIFRSLLRHADIEEVRRLVQATGVFSRTEVRWAGEVVESALRDPAGAGYYALMADGVSDLEGFSCFGPIDGTQNRFDLYWIAVSPTAQGKGLGRKLLLASIEHARERGATHMFIDTSTRADYAAARALYIALGFKLQGTLVDFYSDGDGKAIFGKRL
jgi:ribosomal protein S18 acetylase RimI-like enzyme